MKLGQKVIYKGLLELPLKNGNPVKGDLQSGKTNVR